MEKSKLLVQNKIFSKERYLVNYWEMFNKK